jgi:DNA modification methylase
MIYTGDALEVLKTLPENIFNCAVTSPPYFGLRQYLPAGSKDADKEMGKENTPEEYVKSMVAVFSELKRVLRDDGVFWLNIGDSYANASVSGPLGRNTSRPNRTHTEAGIKPKAGISGIKRKELIGIPWMLAFALRADGWMIRQEIIWHKANAMPEAVEDRCTKNHEQIFMLVKSADYLFDRSAIQEKASGKGGGASFGRQKFDVTGTKAQSRKYSRPVYETRNKRTVWSINTRPVKIAHFAAFPEELVEPCVLSACPPDGIVIDPFAGSGTVGVVCKKHKRNFVGIELNPAYVKMAGERILSVKSI